jgi:hypothetical protein
VDLLVAYRPLARVFNSARLAFLSARSCAEPVTVAFIVFLQHPSPAISIASAEGIAEPTQPAHS